MAAQCNLHRLRQIRAGVAHVPLVFILIVERKAANKLDWVD